MPRPEIDEGMIHAWLDGELSPDESARLEQLVKDDPEWAAAVAEARGLAAASSRILSALDSVPGDVIPAGSRAAPARTPRRHFTVRPWLRAAAGIALVVGTTYAVLEGPGVTDELLLSDGRQTAASDIAAPTAAEPAPATALRAPTVTATVTATETAPIRSTNAAAGTSRVAEAEAVKKEPVVSSLAEGAVLQPPTAVPPAARPPAPTNVPANAPVNVPSPVPQDASRRELELRSTPRRADAVAEERSRAAPPRQGATQDAVARESVLARSALAAKAMAEPRLDGCWRVTSSAPASAPADSVLRDIPIIRTVGDSLELRLPMNRTALVVRAGDELRGTSRGITGAATPWRATRCAPPQ